MLTQLRTALARSRTRYGERLLTTTTVILALVLFVFAPLQAANVIALEAMGFAAALVLIASTVAMSGSLTALALMLFAFCLNGTTVLKRAFDPSTIDVAFLASGWIIVAATLGVVVARDVFAPGRVTVHRIVGAVALYLLIGVVFAGIFAIVGVLIPKAFTGLALADDGACQRDDLFQLRHPDVDRLRRHTSRAPDRAEPEQCRDHHRPALPRNPAGAAGEPAARRAVCPRQRRRVAAYRHDSSLRVSRYRVVNLNGRLPEAATIWSRTILPCAFTRV